MATYAMCIDLTTCVGCDACVLACKMENDVPNGFARDWTEEHLIDEKPELSDDTETGESRLSNLTLELYSSRCQHCENAPCVSVCPTEASYIQDGIVLIERDKCVECTHCIAACPYGARYWVPGQYVDKCTFCNHLIGTNRSTACVEVCPTNSLVFGNIEDSNSEISKLLKQRKYKVLQPSKETSPKYFLLLSEIKRKDLTHDV